MNSRIRVVHVIKGLGRGGAEMLLLETLKYHNRNRFEFHYLYFLPQKSHLAGEISNLGGTVQCLDRSSNISILFSFWRLLRVIRRIEPSIIHAHMPITGFMARIVGRVLGLQVVYTEHFNLNKYHRLTSWLNKLNYNWNDLVIAVSDEAGQAIRQSAGFNGDLRVILNAVDSKSFKRVHQTRERTEEILGREVLENTVVIGTAAVFRKQKQLDIWIRIACELLSTEKHLLFVVMGDGPERDNLRSLADDLGILDSIVFTGLVSSTRDYYNLMDIYLMTSAFEGLPVALLEAMSMECVPVVTPVGGIKDLLSDGVDGFFIDVGDVKECAKLLRSVIENLDLSRAVGIKARELIEQKYSMERMVCELEEAYQSVL